PISARVTATGVRIATTGVLLMKVDSNMAVTSSANNMRVGLEPPTRASTLPSLSTQPVRSSAADSTNMQAMVTGALLDSTLSTSVGVNRVVASRMATAIPTTTSGLSFSRTKAYLTQHSRAATPSGARVSQFIGTRSSCEVSVPQPEPDRVATLVAGA